MPKLKIFIAILTVLCLLVCMVVPSFAAEPTIQTINNEAMTIDDTTGDTTGDIDSDTPWYEYLAKIFLTVADIIGTLFFIIWDAFTGFFGLFDGINDADGPFNWLS